MPFLPPASSVAQANAFARRLAHQLTPARRAALMPFQEALARAAGYPHAHAWHQRLRSTEISERLPALYGAHPARLASWGKALWKAHPQWRSEPARHLPLEQIQAALVQVWGWSSWAEFQARIANAQPKDGPPLTRESFLVHAPSLAELPSALGTGIHGQAHGLHLALGTDPHGDGVGLSVAGARWGHPVVRGEDAWLRRQLAKQWIKARLLQGDQLWIGVAPAQAEVITYVRDQVAESDPSLSLHLYDYRQTGQPVPKVTVTGAVLTQVTLQQAFEFGRDPKLMGVMVTWLSALANAFRYTLPDASLTIWLKWLTAPYAQVTRLLEEETLPRHLRSALEGIVEGFNRTGQGVRPLNIGPPLEQLKRWAEAVLSHVGAEEVEVERTRVIAGMVLPTTGPSLGWISWLWQTAMGGYIGPSRQMVSGEPVTMLSLDLPLGWGWAGAIAPATGHFMAAVIQIIPPTLDTVIFPMISWTRCLRLDLGETADKPVHLSRGDQPPVMLRLAWDSA